MIKPTVNSYSECIAGILFAVIRKIILNRKIEIRLRKCMICFVKISPCNLYNIMHYYYVFYTHWRWPSCLVSYHLVFINKHNIMIDARKDTVFLYLCAVDRYNKHNNDNNNICSTCIIIY